MAGAHKPGGGEEGKDPLLAMCRNVELLDLVVQLLAADFEFLGGGRNVPRTPVQHLSYDLCFVTLQLGFERTAGSFHD